MSEPHLPSIQRLIDSDLGPSWQGEKEVRLLLNTYTAEQLARAVIILRDELVSVILSDNCNPEIACAVVPKE